MVTRRPTADYIPVMVERIVEKFNPLRIILFGSHARGEAGPDSDIDLLVVFEGCADAGARSLEIRAALADVPAPKDVIVTTAPEIERWGHLVGTVLRPAMREGVILHER